MGKSRKLLPRPERADFSSEEEYYSEYQMYRDSFDVSPVEDFSDLNIEFTANGKPIKTPSMSNFSGDIAEILKNKIKDEGCVADPNDVTVVLHEADEPVGAKVYYGGHSEDINIAWTTHEEDYERVMPDCTSVREFSPDYYNMEDFHCLERLTKMYKGTDKTISEEVKLDESLLPKEPESESNDFSFC